MSFIGNSLPLTGGALTGALTGTTASFSGNVGAAGAGLTSPFQVATSLSGGGRALRVTDNASSVEVDATNLAQGAFAAMILGGTTVGLAPGGTVQVSVASGGTTFSTDRALLFTNQTSAAAANTGTLTNAPAAGNPGYWLKVVIGGTNYAIPCWAG